MAKSIQELLHYTALTKSVLRTSQLPNPFPASFWSATEDVLGNSARYRLNFSQRKGARHVRYGAPAIEFELVDVGDATAKLAHFFMSANLSGHQGPILWNQLQAMDSYSQDSAKQHLRHQMEQFGKTFANGRLHALARQLRNGVMHYDANGNPLPSSSGAVYTISNQVSANNQNQLNGIVGASWALNNTDIPLDILELHSRTKRLSGLPIEMALYGNNTVTQFSQNSFVQEFLSRHQPFREAYLQNAGQVIPDGLFGIKKWVHVGAAYYTDNDGTNQDLWGVDDITFCPEPTTGDWFKWFEGSYWIPGDAIGYSDGLAAMQSLKKVQGQFSYARVEMNPPSIVHFAGDTHLPAFKTPDAIFQCHTTP